jgi:hypothetical protein
MAAEEGAGCAASWGWAATNIANPLIATVIPER